MRIAPGRKNYFGFSEKNSGELPPTWGFEPPLRPTELTADEQPASTKAQFGRGRSLAGGAKDG
jgi:hypothetical protein